MFRPDSADTLVTWAGVEKCVSWLTAVLLSAGLGACALPRAAGAPLAQVDRAWAVPTLEPYQQW